MSKEMIVVGVGVLGILMGSGIGYIASETLQEPQKEIVKKRKW